MYRALTMSWAALITAIATLVTSLGVLVGVIRNTTRLKTGNGKTVGQMVEHLVDRNAVVDAKVDEAVRPPGAE